MKGKLSALICAILAACLSLGSLSGCSCSKKKISNESTALVIMSEELDGVFNPFFSTTGPDSEVVSMTQAAMFSSDAKGEIAYGYKEPSIVLDYDQFKNTDNTTTYTFVLKNGIRFSDGVPLSIRDVLFNMYVYLDPVYTGSSTMYSTEIVGLNSYRTQNSHGTEEDLESDAVTAAEARIDDLWTTIDGIIDEASSGSNIKQYTAETMLAELETRYGREHQFVSDYKLACEKFRKELETDYRSAKEAYIDPPYQFNEVQSFMYLYGYCDWDNKNKVVKAWLYDSNVCHDEASAINFVYNAFIPGQFTNVALASATASELITQFAAEYKESVLSNPNRQYKNIEGIVAVDGAKVPTVTIGDKTYKVAKLPHDTDKDGADDDMGSFNADWSLKNPGTEANADGEYQVLQIKINGVDPKAIWNFGFIVAPLHYYSSDALTKSFSIDNNQFGVQYSTLDFMEKTLKGGDKVGVPLGAGAYKATDRNNSNKPSSGGFRNNNIVYFTRNDDFFMGKPIIKLIRYQVVNSSQSINVVTSGAVHYSMPQATPENMKTIESGKKSGKLDYVQNSQNGYGYIGINAGKIPEADLRRAIMSACDTSLALDYYGTTAEPLAWPMSKVSWAYPKTATGQDDDNPMYPYGNGTDKSDKAVQDKVISYMTAAGVTVRQTSPNVDDPQYGAGKGLAQYEIISGQKLKYTFTIAGANLTEHPTYATFNNAARILNATGWDIEVRPDSYALTKLATGSLTVWAAAWSSTIDPDMYQVYHRNSRATSVLNWGYREIKAQQSSPIHSGNFALVKQLSDKIDAARKLLEKDDREPIYKDALNLVMQLAVELPVYQRDNVYLFNPKVIDGDTLDKSKSAYSNPLSRIWEVSLKEN